MGKKKKLSGAAKRKKRKEKEEAIVKAVIELERLKLGPTKLWTGLVTHHRDIFVSHVLPKLNRTDRYFFSKANTKHVDLLEYAGVNVSREGWCIHECSSISTLELAWNSTNWGKELDDGTAIDQAWFCFMVAVMNKLEFLKWVREEKKCEWGEQTINMAALIGNLEMLKYCFANDCPCDEQQSCRNAAGKGHVDCLRFLFDTMKPSRETEQSSASAAAIVGRIDILKYFVEERKIAANVKTLFLGRSALEGHLHCLKYLVEEAKTPLDDWQHIATARYFEQPECLHYLREKGCPEPTDAQYARAAAHYSAIQQQQKQRTQHI
jgi:hypothetical protein